MTALLIITWIISLAGISLYQNRKTRNKLIAYQEDIKRLQAESTSRMEEWTSILKDLHAKLVKEEEDIQWVVNSSGELGVHIIPIDRYFFRYKEHTLEYAPHEDNYDGPRFVRPVKKREFGEVNGEPLPDGWTFDINDPSVRPLRPQRD